MGYLTALRVKYGTAPSEPTETQAREWLTRTRALIAVEVEPEEAGRRAAREAFPTAGRYVYRSMADTIYDLIQSMLQSGTRGG